MKQNFFTANRTQLKLSLLFFLFISLLNFNLNAQTDLTCDGTEITIDHNGSYQDYTVPTSPAKNYLHFVLEGADGGKASSSSTGKGGEGATIAATFKIGTATDEIPPGSIIRFIIGEEGRSSSNGTAAGGKGGGGSAIFLQELDSTKWELLMVAGGGGGGWANLLGATRDGRGGRAGESGGNGGDADTNGGSGGSPGRGGGSSAEGGGGGGAFDNGSSYLTSDNASGGRAGWQNIASDATENATINPQGGNGGCGSGGCTPANGFGFGGGGWSTQDGGGGGGGYSGGGAGGRGAQGGGGGSYVSDRAINDHKNDGGSTGSPNNGKATYQCVNAPTALCQDYSFSIGTESDLTISPNDIDNGSSSDLGFTLSVSPSTFSCDDIGENTATLTLNDDALLVATCTATVVVSDEATSFNNMVDNNTAHFISGNFQDLLIPENTTKNALLLELNGGDGGKKRNSSTIPCAGGTGRGGKGAVITTLFNIGTGSGEIPPGSIVRFVVGEKGKSVSGTGGIEGAGGGGGTAVLYRESEDCDWVILAVAGGGGGGWSDGCYDHSDGQGGRTTTSGGDGKGSNVNVGDGGTNGGGGGSGRFGGVDYSGGGGGATGNGGAINCTGNPDWGDGKRGGTIGGAGGSDGGSCGSGRDGGFGFGGGGLGDGSGGGGGGYSGGGGGGSSGGGGGGGSYVSDLSADDYTNDLAEGGSTADPENGYINYTILDRTAPVALCNTSTAVSVSHTTTATVAASTIDNNSYDPEGGALEYDLSPNSFDCGDIGNHIVTLTVTDNTELTSSCTAQVIVSYNVSGVTNLNDNGSEHTVNQNGSYQDFKIPEHTHYSRITLFARGGDGGKRRVNVAAYSCTAKGGRGARTEATFKIGCGSNEIPPGSILRFIVGKEGKSLNSAGIEGAGGGGGSGILYKAPGTCTWEILMVAGGGGGGYTSGTCGSTQSNGKPGNDNTNGSGSGGKGSNSGSGGSNGNGGNVHANFAGAGGGAFSDGENINCNGGNNWGGGEKGAYNGGDGGSNGSNGCGGGRNGGFGFGGGGLGDGAGGGGGGYSGGGAGGSGGGGGGGGSWINGIGITTSITNNGSTNSPDNGWCTYEFGTDTGSDVDADPTAVCQNITVNLDESGNVVVYPEEVDNGSSDACGTDYLRFYFGSSLAYKSYSCSDAGSTFNVTMTVKDFNGNSDNCTATITVQETEAPTAICQDYTVEIDSGGSTTIAGTDIDDGSTDNCSISSRTLSKSTFTSSDVGTQSVTLTVSDAAGNSATCSANVTVEVLFTIDALCQNTSVNLDNSGNASIMASAIDNSSTASLGIASLTLDQSSFNCSHVGSNTVNLTVTDNDGNSSSCSATVTVADNVAPAALCSNYILQLNASGMGTLTTANIDNSSNDACGVQSLSLSETSFACADVGNQNVTLTVTDQNNNSSTCSATVSVQDNVAPNALCSNHTLQLNAAGMVTLTSANIDNNSSDACGIQSLALSQESFVCGEVGNQSVTLTVTDQNNNSSTCSAMVAIEDNVMPVAACQNVTVVLTAAGMGVTSANEVNDGSADACGIQMLSLNKEAFNCSEVGPNTVILTATDNNDNTNTCTATVTVEDNTAPIAVCQSATVQLNASGNGTLQAMDVEGGSSDACGVQTMSINLDAFNCSNLGENTVVLSITDVNSNTSTCTATVTVEDNIAPIALCQSVTVQLDENGVGSISPDQVNNVSSDACGVQQLALDITDFTCSHIGTNTHILTATDGSSNTSTCSATITVEDNGIPEAICQAATIQLNSEGIASLTAGQIDANSSDACTEVSLTVDINSFNCSNVGPNAVYLTATDGYGNSSSCSAVVTVEDNVAPEALCQTKITELDNAGNVSIQVSDIDAGSNDACGINTMTLSQEAFDCSHVGKSTVVLTVTDVNGNTSTCTADVIVEDNILPIAQCQNLTVDLNGDGQESIQASQVEAGSSDACGINAYQLSNTTFDCSNLGENTVYLTVHDVNSNSSSCSATITVEDNILSSAICTNATVELNSLGQGTLPPENVDGGSSDACSQVYFEVDNDSFDCNNLGGNTVILTVSDDGGNSATCSAMVTVVDIIPPTPICLNPIIDFNGEDQIPLTVEQLWNEDSSTDNCTETFFVSMSVSQVSCDQIGSIIPVTVTIEDGSANTANCTAMVSIDGLPCNWQTTDDGIGCPGGNSADYNAQTGSYSITSQGCYSPYHYRPSDTHGYVGTNLCGDGEIIALVSDISGSAWAGITMRESLDPSAKMIQVMVNNSGLARREVRTSTGGVAFAHLFQNQGKYWVRLTRIGDQFGAYLSLDGQQWDIVFLINLPMANCIDVGLITMNENSDPATATFDNVMISGGLGLGLQGLDHTTDQEYDDSTLDFGLYPNPSSGDLNLTLDQFIGEAIEIQVFNQFGQIVSSKKIEEVQFSIERLDFNTLPGGTYLIKLNTMNKQAVKKFILNKL